MVDLRATYVVHNRPPHKRGAGNHRVVSNKRRVSMLRAEIRRMASKVRKLRAERMSDFDDGTIRFYERIIAEARVDLHAALQESM